MAEEITVIGQGPLNQFSLFFLYPIPSPIQVANANVIPTPADGGAALPEMVRRVITNPEIAALDAGEAAFEIAEFKPEDGMTNAALINKAKEIYGNRKALYLARYTQHYNKAGYRINGE